MDNLCNCRVSKKKNNQLSTYAIEPTFIDMRYILPRYFSPKKKRDNVNSKRVDKRRHGVSK